MIEQRVEWLRRLDAGQMAGPRDLGPVRIRRPVEQLTRHRRRDEHIGRTAHHQHRDADSRQRRPAVGPIGHAERRRHQRARRLRQHHLPHPVAHVRVGQLTEQPVAIRIDDRPRTRCAQRVGGGQAAGPRLLAVRRGTRVRQHQRIDPVGCAQRDGQRDIAAHRQADEARGAHAEPVELVDDVVGVRVHRDRRTVGVGLAAEAAQVESDHAPMAAQTFDLRLPQPPVAAERMKTDDRRALAPLEHRHQCTLRGRPRTARPPRKPPLIIPAECRRP
ncbi:MAG TPA: hypothetical protein PKA20_12990 [Burkholderiaceae bacterium]|nr:hypothetical protein [Burkholderiaceae bacterium]